MGGSLTRKGSIERRAPTHHADDLANQLDTFKPIVITVTSFFKQVNFILVQYLTLKPLKYGASRLGRTEDL